MLLRKGHAQAVLLHGAEPLLCLTCEVQARGLASWPSQACLRVFCQWPLLQGVVGQAVQKLASPTQYAVLVSAKAFQGAG